MKAKSTRPRVVPLSEQNFHDLEGADILHIPANYITFNMLSSNTAKNDGTEVGRYGTGQYGRCVYGAPGPKGIYGADHYGVAIYW